MIKYLHKTAAEQKVIRKQGGDACIHNASIFDTSGEIAFSNPYEFKTEEWNLWKEGYLEALARQIKYSS